MINLTHRISLRFYNTVDFHRDFKGLVNEKVWDDSFVDIWQYVWHKVKWPIKYKIVYQIKEDTRWKY